MTQEAVTVEQVRKVQDHVKKGLDLHTAQNYKEAIEEFKKAASINPKDPNHLSDLTKKLKAQGVKLVQESVGYMGCALVHMNGLVKQLSPDEIDQVPLEKSLAEAFESWDE